MASPLPLYPPPLEAGVLLAMAPWDGADHWEELELDATMEHSRFNMLHTLSEEVGPGLLFTLLPPSKAPKHPSKPSHSHQDEMLCHRRFRVLSGYRGRPILDPLCLHRDVHMDHNQDQLIQLTVQSK